MLNNIRKLYLFNFLQNLTFFGAVSVLFFISWANLNYTQIFLLQVWFTFWLFILEVPTGTIADKFGRRLSLIISGLAVSAGAVSYSVSPNIYLFLMAEFLFALGLAFKSGTDKALLYDSLKEAKKAKESKYFFSRYALSATAGIAVSLPLGSLFAGSNFFNLSENLRLTMLFSSIPFFLSCIIAFTLSEPKRVQSSKDDLTAIGLRGIKLLFKNKALRSFALDMTLISASTFFIFWFYQPLLLNAGFSVAILGFVAAGFNVLASLFLSQIKHVENLFGVKRLLFMTALVPAIFYAGLVFIKSYWFVLAAVFIIATSKILREPIFDHYMNKFIRSKERATVLSAIGMIQRIMIAVLYPIMGFLADISVYHAVAVLAALTFIFAVFGKVDEVHLQTRKV